MNTHEDRARDYLLHIRDALGKILEYTAGVTDEAFVANRMMQDAVVRNIGIVGEAAKQLMDVAPVFSSQHSEIPFAHIYGMRNRVIHGYASVNIQTVWDVVMVDAPELKEQIEGILAELHAADDSSV